MHHHALLFPAIEFDDLLLCEGYNAVRFGMDSEIPANVCIDSWTEFCTFLPHNYSPGPYGLTAKELHAAALASAIPYVAGRTTCFLMCHALNSREVC